MHNTQPEFGLRSATVTPVPMSRYSQTMIHQKMSTHYRKLANVKSTIDFSPPKSMLTSTKARDRARREIMKQQGNRPRSAYGSVSSREEDFLPRDSVSRDVLIHQMNETMRRPAHYTSRSQQLSFPSKKQVYTPPESADPLQKYPHMFSSTGDFAPKTLKTNVSSRLSQNPKIYTAPRGAKYRAASSLSRAETVASVQTNLEDMKLSMPSERKTAHETGVPRLDITTDADHIKWIQEQAGRAKLRTNVETTSRRGSPGDNFTISRSLLDDGQSSDGKFSATNQMLPKSDGPLRTVKLSSTGKSSTLRQVANEEEEAKYLEFVKEVTDDVLTRNVFTNQALKQIFEYHIERRKKELKESIMRQMLDNLKHDLGIPQGEHIDPEDIGFGSPPRSVSTSPWRETETNDEGSVDVKKARRNVAQIREQERKERNQASGLETITDRSASSKAESEKAKPAPVAARRKPTSSVTEGDEFTDSTQAEHIPIQGAAVSADRISEPEELDEELAEEPPEEIEEAAASGSEYNYDDDEFSPGVADPEAAGDRNDSSTGRDEYDIPEDENDREPGVSHTTMRPGSSSTGRRFSDEDDV